MKVMIEPLILEISMAATFEWLMRWPFQWSKDVRYYKAR